jgi:hypothetical protein
MHTNYIYILKIKNKESYFYNNAEIAYISFVQFIKNDLLLYNKYNNNIILCQYIANTNILVDEYTFNIDNCLILDKLLIDIEKLLILGLESQYSFEKQLILYKKRLKKENLILERYTQN